MPSYKLIITHFNENNEILVDEYIDYSEETALIDNRENATAELSRKTMDYSNPQKLEERVNKIVLELLFIHERGDNRPDSELLINHRTIVRGREPVNTTSREELVLRNLRQEYEYYIENDLRINNNFAYSANGHILHIPN